jgi:hypothetical protein
MSRSEPGGIHRNLADPRDSRGSKTSFATDLESPPRFEYIRYYEVDFSWNKDICVNLLLYDTHLGRKGIIKLNEYYVMLINTHLGVTTC